ncbi:hypothetical protein [Chryseobacterium limigenitum]|uniref:Uncharacterized protein n=1 Tax=Chryseobacterium limigenitum TaxID=1612149 RepID=A0A1K2IX30_9FLAO|nr:hypothetical protein [Chryseobacterium limigenitum]SFZ96919.1 hypothetical protein SAMN05216324_13013 [Chryseobacterium limigenitum]
MKFRQRLASSLLLLLISVIAYGQYTYDEACDILRKNGYTVSDGKYNRLQQGYSFDYARKFQAGNHYAVIAYTGSEYVKDIGLLLWLDDGELLFQQPYLASNFESANFAVKWDREVKIEIRNESAMYPDYKFYCGFVIGYKNMDDSSRSGGDGSRSIEIRNTRKN